MYSDTKFTTAAEKERAFKTFKRVIDKRDSSLIDKNLYNHLHLHCGFIAHYDIHGFRNTYSGIEGFREFIEQFDSHRPQFNNWCHWVYGDYRDVNQDMVDYVTARAAKIYAELDSAKREAEIALAQALLAKHGINIGVKEPEPVVCIVDEGNGQLTMGF